jgi:hypothetical protein
MNRLDIGRGIAGPGGVPRRTPLSLELQAGVARVGRKAERRACIAVTAVFQVGFHRDGLAGKEDVVVKGRIHRRRPAAVSIDDGRRRRGRRIEHDLSIRKRVGRSVDH